MADSKMIVVDGPDGTGKETVVSNLQEMFNEHKTLSKLPLLIQSFPNYSGFYGQQVSAYKAGDSADEVVRMPKELRDDPICASVPYALDRYQTYHKVMKPKLEQGHWFICDRYYTSNMGHQGSKMTTTEERLAFFDRLMFLELEYLQIPKPRVVIILDLPDEVRERRTNARRDEALTMQVTSSKVAVTDIHEQDPDHMRRASDTYRLMASHFSWPLISGVENDRELTREEMAEKVYWKILSCLR